MKRYSIKVNGKVFDVEVEERNAAATAASVSAESADEAKDTDSRDAADAGERAADTGAKAAAESGQTDRESAIHRSRTPKTPKKKEQPARIPEGVSSQEDSLSSPMPGTVVKICVNPGDEVYAGETLIILEAMKMENEINSHKTGRVGMIAVKTGDAVNTGDVLLTVD